MPKSKNKGVFKTKIYWLAGYYDFRTLVDDMGSEELLQKVEMLLEV